MRDATTVDILATELAKGLPTTESWAEPQGRPRTRIPDLSRVAAMTGLAVIFSVSPVSAIPDPWFLERRRRDAVVSVSIYRDVIGRFISRAEALRIARQILEQAESERLAAADYEALRGMQWGAEP